MNFVVLLTNFASLIVINFIPNNIISEIHNAKGCFLSNISENTKKNQSLKTYHLHIKSVNKRLNMAGSSGSERKVKMCAINEMITCKICSVNT